MMWCYQVIGETHNLQGRSIEPQRAKPRGSGGAPRGGGGSKKLYLGSLDEELSESDIRDHFSAFGNVRIHSSSFFCWFLISFLNDE